MIVGKKLHLTTEGIKIVKYHLISHLAACFCIFGIQASLGLECDLFDAVGNSFLLVGTRGRENVDTLLDDCPDLLPLHSLVGAHAHLEKLFLSLGLYLGHLFHSTKSRAHEIAVVASRTVAAFLELESTVNRQLLARALSERFGPLQLARIALAIEVLVTLRPAELKLLRSYIEKEEKVSVKSIHGHDCKTKSQSRIRSDQAL